MPVVDLGSWRTAGPGARAQVARHVSTACATLGFFQVTGHGVDPDLVGAMLAAHDRLFGLAPSEKRRLLCPPEANRGYSPSGADPLAQSQGIAAPPDCFEAFNLGREVVDETDPAVAAVRDSFLAPNVWPSSPPWIRDVLVDYFAAVADLARTITRIFAAALELPEEFFLERCQHPTETLRLIRYEEVLGAPEALDGQQGMGAHTDDGIVTVLHADRVPGFELVGPDGRWWPVIPAEGAFVVNIGDLLAEWTNDRWRSTVHRVVPPPSSHVPEPDPGPGRFVRRSAAFFLDGDHDCLVECLPTCTSTDDPPRYPPIRAGEHLRQKSAGSREGRVPATVDTVRDRIGAVVDG
jgi:isopenicillin N synthase-like dioxygenase